MTKIFVLPTILLVLSVPGYADGLPTAYDDALTPYRWILFITLFVILGAGIAFITMIAKDFRGKKCPQCKKRLKKYYGDHGKSYIYQCMDCKIEIDGNEIFDIR